MLAKTPTLAGFITFIRNVMGLSAQRLPDDAPVIEMAYCVALNIVNRQMSCVDPQIYTLAVYNLGGDNLINYAQDPDDAPIYKNDMTFFAYIRKTYDTAGFVPGVVQSTADESTSSSFVVQKFAEQFTIGNLQNLKTPYGRQYLAFAQAYGPSIWGLTP
jgi:hypothetical protein